MYMPLALADRDLRDLLYASTRARELRDTLARLCPDEQVEHVHGEMTRLAAEAEREPTVATPLPRPCSRVPCEAVMAPPPRRSCSRESATAS